MIIYVIWIKIFDGIEYEHHISLDIRIMADHVTLVFLAFLKSIFKLEPSNLVCWETFWATVIYIPGLAKFQYVYFFIIFYAFPN